ncbi:alpha/beta hydrolase [Mammaliicoccus sp. Dog046]|uniref:alpha/beta hydrolase n=1 Tax=Mammaliicoccus sp. Dog046 TaxID=3034233 RepID=UPI002B26270B|nr:alpha/beta hydrolase [Mammaliicoccus sp. Dog046]WQK86716.1 alpha/beta hydrolase [Mammaliicoccus sp. Dog046]
MKLKESRNIYLKGGNEAVLLLHSFTGTIRDVKDLAEILHKVGFTCYVPAYKGHGLSIESFLAYDVRDWWAQVEAAYQFLIDEGYEVINVLGVSLGGLMSLKLSETHKINKCIAMSTPQERYGEDIKSRLKRYGKKMNEIQGLNQEESERQLALIEDYDQGAKLFTAFIVEIMNDLKEIKNPISIMYGGQDQQLYKESAEYIYNNVATEDKTLKEYKNASHLMTRSEDHEKIEQDIMGILRT